MNTVQKGFTLLELLVVMVIIGLLVGYVGPRYFGQLSKSEVKAAKAQIDAFKKALDVYRLDTGAYPDQASGLLALVVAPQSNTQWQGPYLQKDIPNDPWGHPYVYRIPGEKREYELISLGADGQPGGVDEHADIVE
jgi:general secretion pathway protein G